MAPDPKDAAYVPEWRRGVKTLAVRVELHEYAILRKMLHNDELSMQGFLGACVDAYVKGDTNMKKLIQDHKRLALIPGKIRANYPLSRSERDAIFDEIDDSTEVDD